MISPYLNFLELRKFLKFGPTEPHCFLYLFRAPTKDKMVSLSVVEGFFQNTFWEILRDPLFGQNAKSLANPNESKIFFKESPIIRPKIEVRVDSWDLWEIHLLIFRDFQESPNPLKIPIPTPIGCAEEWYSICWISMKR